MNEPTFADIVSVHSRKPDDFEYRMKLGMLRDVAKRLEVGDEWRLQCERLMCELAALRSRLPA